jgi:histidinol phosphatase-like PHP family hydrolase
MKHMNAIDYDVHIHTAYCGHAPEMTVEAVCARADALGLRLIAITDHIFEPGDHAVIERIRAEAAALSPRCRVLVGAEVDVDSDFADGRLVTDDLDGLDYVIAGFHYVPTMGHYPWSIKERRMDIERFLELWESSLLGIVSNPRIDTLAHPGRMLAACTELDDCFEYGLAVLEKAAALSAKNKIAWELNELTGHRLPGRWQEQWYRLYEVALAAGVKIIFGSDAHTLDSIGMQTFARLVLEKLPNGCLSQPEDVMKHVNG